MKRQISIRDIFPTQNEIPSKSNLQKKINQKEYLVYGELRKWSTMPVEQRISCMEEFIFRMNEKILKKIMRENKSSFLSTDYIL